jgi:phospholipid N-methyltransferase
MTGCVSEYITFFREFRQSFHTTGALMPSSRFLARALARAIAVRSRAMRILEAGPGTGAVTQEIIRHVGPGDVLHVVEPNGRFVESLRKRFVTDPHFRPVASQTRIIHAAVQDLSPDEPYDSIVCGIPFNNLSPATVRTIFSHMLGMLRPGGAITFFEYLWIRPLKILVSSSSERHRVAEVGYVLRDFIDRYECRRERVLMNVFPAMVHCLQKCEAAE